MKINQEMKRKIVQVAAFGYSNTYIGNFVSGQIYKGRWKQFCNPGMNAGRWNSTLSTHPELRATLGALFSVKACILIITLIGCLSVGSSVKSCVHLEQSTDY